MKHRLFAGCALLLALHLHLPAWGDPELEFKAANALMDQKDYKGALQRYRAALKEAPDSPNILFNAGLAAYLNGDYRGAVELFRELKRLQPDDWRARAKLIQAYQAAGQPVECEREHDALMELKKAATTGELKEQKTFVRDQFVVEGRRVFAAEHFTPEGERAVIYTFVIQRPGADEAEKFRITLGSYESTTRLARETGQIGPQERMYHLDYYAVGEHRTYGMYTTRPAYEDVKKSVCEILLGKLKPISSSKSEPSKE